MFQCQPRPEACCLLEPSAPGQPIAPARPCPSMAFQAAAAAIETIIAQPQFDGARFGVCAQRRGDPVDLVSMNADTFFTPASNTKLFTVAAAQRILDMEATLDTSFWFAPPVRAGAASTLTVLGGGDPTLTFAQLSAAAAALAEHLPAAPMDIRVDVSAFGRMQIPEAWDWDYISTTSGVLSSSVVVDRNTMHLCVLPPASVGGEWELQWEHACDPDIEVDTSALHIVAEAHASSSAVSARYRVAGGSGGLLLSLVGQLRPGDPAVRVDVPCLNVDRRAGLLLAEALETAGAPCEIGRISVTADSRPKQSVDGAVHLHVLHSLPLGEILRDCMQPSDNLYAECLLRMLEPAATDGERGGMASAQAALKQAVTAVGVNPRKLRLLDGSGMCAKNWICPRACIQLLQGKALAGEEGAEFDSFL